MGVRQKETDWGGGGGGGTSLKSRQVVFVHSQ